MLGYNITQSYLVYCIYFFMFFHYFEKFDFNWLSYNTVNEYTQLILVAMMSIYCDFLKTGHL